MPHVEKVFVQFKDCIPFNETAYTMWHGCHLLGIHSVPFKQEDIDSLEITKGTLVHGGIGMVRKALRLLGVEEPHVDGAPEELLPFFGRKIWTTTMEDVRQHLESRKIFIKPLRAHKLFNGHVTSGEIRDLIQTAAVPDETELLASDPVKFITEYRLFIHHGLIVGCKHYAGDFTQLIDFNVAYGCIRAFTTQPVAWSLDLGVTDDNRTIVVEVNDAFSLGAYGLPSIPYVQMVEDRWVEMVGLV